VETVLSSSGIVDATKQPEEEITTKAANATTMSVYTTTATTRTFNDILNENKLALQGFLLESNRWKKMISAGLVLVLALVLTRIVGRIFWEMPRYGIFCHSCFRKLMAKPLLILSSTSNYQRSIKSKL
jgi:hypothetical protein